MTIPKEMLCSCVRCKHTWIKRKAGRPAACPGCHETNWDVPAGKLPRGRPPKKKAKARPEK